jgi:hypothetical protein
MKQLVQSLIDWLDQNRSDVQPHRVLRALAEETRKRADSPDQEQREFDALQIAQAAGQDVTWDYETAKRWLTRADVIKYLEVRQINLRDFFQRQGHSQALEVRKSESSGRHRAMLFLAAVPIPDEVVASNSDESIDSQPTPTVENQFKDELEYEFTPSEGIKKSLVGRMFLGASGQAATLSFRGLLWAGLLISSFVFLAAIVWLVWAMTTYKRPVQASDLAQLLLLGSIGWAVWRLHARPLVWLVDDRVIPAPEVLAGWSELPCQLEMSKEDDKKYFRLVRFSGVCPVCAGRIELRYGTGDSARRLFGACNEAPQEHVYEFDRVTRLGQRYRR